MNKKVIYHQLTSAHVGSGSTLGIVDLPIQREVHTDFPVIPSSAIKGVLRANFEKQNKTEADILFGSQDQEGDIVFTDAKIILFPVKSLKGVFVWITSPLVLSRFERDVGQSVGFDYNVGENQAKVSSKNVLVGNSIILEEFSFNAVEDNNLKKLKNITSQFVEENKIVILPDDIFRFFVKNYTEIIARIKIDQEKGTVKEGGLWYQELTPAETVFYGLITSRTKNQENLSKIQNFINEKIFQFGGDETLGRGFTRITVGG